MLTWIMYDIQKDKIRNRVAKACEEIGIYRVQKSVFLGELSKSQVREIHTVISDLIDTDVDSVYIFPMSKNDFDNCILLGQAFDKNLITDEVKALLL